MRKYQTLFIASLFVPSSMFGLAAVAQTPYEQSHSADESAAQRPGAPNSAGVDTTRRPTREEAQRTCDDAPSTRMEDICISCLTQRAREDKSCEKPWYAWQNGIPRFGPKDASVKKGHAIMRFRTH